MSKNDYIADIVEMLERTDDVLLVHYIHTLLKRTSK